MEVDGQTVVVIGGVSGALVGAVAWLFRQLVIAKDQRIHELESELEFWRSAWLRGQPGPPGVS